MKLKLGQNSNGDKAQIVRKKFKKKLKCDQTQIVTKLQNSNYDNSKTQIVTKLNKTEIGTKLEIRQISIYGDKKKTLKWSFSRNILTP